MVALEQLATNSLPGLQLASNCTIAISPLDMPKRTEINEFELSSRSLPLLLWTVHAISVYLFLFLFLFSFLSETCNQRLQDTCWVARVCRCTQPKEPTSLHRSTLALHGNGRSYSTNSHRQPP